MIHKYDFIKEKEKAVNVEKYRWVYASVSVYVVKDGCVK